MKQANRMVPVSRLGPRRAALVGAFSLLVLSACQEVHRTTWTRESPADRAKAITRSRKDAIEALGVFEASEYTDLEAINRAVDAERRTTEISPAGCPSCFREYGKVLSIRGHYYRVLYEETLQDAESAAARERASFKEEAKEYWGLMEADFRASNKAYRVYFANPEVPIVDAREVERVMRHHEYLREYREALYYLDEMEPLALAGREGDARRRIRANVETLRRFYQRQIAGQAESRYRDRDRRDAERDRPSSR